MGDIVSHCDTESKTEGDAGALGDEPQQEETKELWCEPQASLP